MSNEENSRNIVHNENHLDADVIIIGSGLSGLSCALRTLEGYKHKKSLLDKMPKILILEADSIKGGRTRSEDFHIKNSPKVSYGGTWVVLDNEELVALSHNINHMPYVPKEIFNLNYSKNSLSLINPLHCIYGKMLWELGHKIFAFEEENKDKIGVKNIFAYLDSINLHDWTLLHLPPHPTPSDIEHHNKLRDVLVSWFFQVENYSGDISKLSTYFAAKSIYVRVSNITHTGFILPRVMRWPDGTGAVIDKVFNKIKDLSPHSDIVFNQLVTNIAQFDGYAEVTSKDLGDGISKKKWRAKCVVVASSIKSATENISYEPPLPEGHFNVIRSLQKWDDPSLQIVLIFKSQFWELEHRGTIIYPKAIPDDQTGVYGPVFDLSGDSLHKNAKAGIVRIICKRSRCMIGDQMQSDEWILNSSLQYLAQYHKLRGESEAKTITRIRGQLTKFWKFDFNETAGIEAVTYYFSASNDSSYANNYHYLNQSHGTVFFAGSERATRGFNWMEGAVLSGREAAKKVLAELFKGNWTKKDAKEFEEIYQKEKEKALKSLKNIKDTIRNLPENVKYLGHLFSNTIHTISPIPLPSFRAKTMSTASSDVAMKKVIVKSEQPPESLADGDEQLHPFDAKVNADFVEYLRSIGAQFGDEIINDGNNNNNNNNDNDNDSIHIHDECDDDFCPIEIVEMTDNVVNEIADDQN